MHESALKPWVVTSCAFCHDIIGDFRLIYFKRRPNLEEHLAMEEKYNRVDFLECVGAVDCMKFKCKNYPLA